MAVNLDDFEFRWKPGTEEYELYYQGQKWGDITAMNESGQRTIMGLTRDQHDFLKTPDYHIFANHAQAAILAHMMWRKTAEDAAYYESLTETV